MQTLDPDQLQLLLAVRQGRVHMDPRFTLPDFEREPDSPFMTRRATRRLRPFKAAGLVELVDEDQADQFGVRGYQLTGSGEQVVDAALAAEAAANADA